MRGVQLKPQKEACERGPQHVEKGIPLLIAKSIKGRNTFAAPCGHGLSPEVLQQTSFNGQGRSAGQGYGRPWHALHISDYLESYRLGETRLSGRVCKEIKPEAQHQTLRRILRRVLSFDLSVTRFFASKNLEFPLQSLSPHLQEPTCTSESLQPSSVLLLVMPLLLLAMASNLIANCENQEPFLLVCHCRKRFSRRNGASHQDMLASKRQRF